MAKESPTDGLSQIEDWLAVKILKKWKGGRISTPLYSVLAGMTPQPIVEVVFFRKRDGILETLLIPRPDNDIVWRGKCHTPGSAIRNSDINGEDGNPLKSVFDRIRKEIDGDFSDPVSVGIVNISGENTRGASVTQVFFAELPESYQPSQGRMWYPVEGLAENKEFIQEQLGFVQAAAEQYRKVVRR